MALILLIDDDSFYRGVLRQILEDGGHQITEAVNGPEGLERFRSQRPDLVITGAGVYLLRRPRRRR